MTLTDKQVLITGGAGFIGSHIVDAYLDEPVAKVIVFDDFSSGTQDNLAHIDDNRLVVVAGNILNKSEIDECFKQHKIDIVNHLAAELEVYRGIENVQWEAEINIFGTINVLQACLQYGVKKVLYASSGGIYGQAKSIPQKENHPWDPHWPYGVSKLAAERYCRQFYQLHGLPTVAFRYAIIYGPREWYGRVLTMFLRRVFIENKPPVVFGDGKQRRDYLYVADVARAHILATKNDSAAGHVFNLGSAHGISIGQLAEKIVGKSGRELKVIYDDPPEGQASQHQPGRVRLVGELQDFILDYQQAEKHLGWKPTVDFDEGLDQQIAWLLENPKRWNTKPKV